MSTQALSLVLRPLSMALRPLSPGRLIRLWASLARNRAALSRLDPHLLADIGLTADEAAREASRPFWDVPAHWRR